jgi:hypothetical protein
VEVADNNNNTIATFGRYGNQNDGVPSAKRGARSDESSSSTPHSALPAPHSDIPLAWPTYVAVSDDYAYVNDTVGMRVVRVKLGAAAEEICVVE